MLCRPHRIRWIQRLGLLGVALVFLLQTVAWSNMPVFASSLDDDWIVICTSNGIKRIPYSVDVVPDGESKNNTSPTSIDYCDLCLFAHGLGMAPAPATVHQASMLAYAPRVRSEHSVPVGAYYAPQQPRAPPAIG